MYCVIQKIKYKSKEEYKNLERLKFDMENKNRFRGCHKELQVTSFTHGSDGNIRTKYSYTYGGGRFERYRLDAYKISIHHSYRENGKVKKKQWAICTIGYYDFIDCGSYDYLNVDDSTLDEMKLTYDEYWDLVNEKLNPIEDAIRNEYEQSDEYKAKKYQREVLSKYQVDKAAFRTKYNLDEYDYIYDVFGNLMNEEYLDKIERDYKFKKEYERKSYEYQRQSYSNSSGGSSYSYNSISNYSDDEKVILKEIYRIASKKFHPDISKDDGSKMKFLTKLKDQWGL